MRTCVARNLLLEWLHSKDTGVFTSQTTDVSVIPFIYLGSSGRLLTCVDFTFTSVMMNLPSPLPFGNTTVTTAYVILLWLKYSYLLLIITSRSAVMDLSVLAVLTLQPLQKHSQYQHKWLLHTGTILTLGWREECRSMSSQKKIDICYILALLLLPVNLSVKERVLNFRHPGY